jgi:hypothetical protein
MRDRQSELRPMLRGTRTTGRQTILGTMPSHEMALGGVRINS